MDEVPIKTRYTEQQHWDEVPVKSNYGKKQCHGY